MRFRAGLLTLGLLSLPASGRAFPGAPLCAVPEESEDHTDLPGQICEPSAGYLVQSHVLDERSLALDECAPVSGREPEQQSYEIAKRALSRARELEQTGRHDAALLHLRVVEATLPRVADYIAIMRAELHMRAGDPRQAARAFADAMRVGMNTDLVARAHVGYVRNLLDAGAPDAERELEALLRRYPKLPEAPMLKLALARHREGEGLVKTAMATYRTLDLTLPGYPVAADARARIAELQAQGVPSAPYTTAEQLSRAEKLVRSGPVDLARAALSELEPLLKAKSQLAQLEALRTRLEGTDASHVPEEAPEVDASNAELTQKRVRALLGNKKLDKMRPFQLTSMLDVASREALTEAADALVLELSRRARTSPPEVRFDALTTAVGTASDSALVALADTLVDHPTLAAAARYHRARAIERMGQVEDAKAELSRVIELDQSPTRFYANWADQRLRVLAGERPSACVGPIARCDDAEFSEAVRALEASLEPDLSAALTLLEKANSEYGQGFPWLGRALDLARIGEARSASDELYEALLAYRSITSRRGIRAGLEAVYRGRSVVRPATSADARRLRLSLGLNGRLTLARACAALGDDGTAAMFGGPEWAESRPHPYPREVALAAKKHGIDPDLLFAVMRVESVYQRRIISHAGAIGLMQIMPRTGRLIADQLGEHDRTTSDLLDPETNLDFAAWYLKSLISRMDGHLPLAIASYNGGPHNVRKWIRSFGDHVPLDAFLERIPFTETRRYVRRVLGYYARYKSLRGAKIAVMDVTLPSTGPTDVTF